MDCRWIASLHDGEHSGCVRRPGACHGLNFSLDLRAPLRMFINSVVRVVSDDFLEVDLNVLGGMLL